jgi:hypothetical protein
MLKNDLKYLTPLRITGYPVLYNNKVPMSPDMVLQYMFDNQPMDYHFSLFLKSLQNNQTFYPIYRMADGEFAFCLDRHRDLLKIIKGLIKRGNTNFKTMYGESYSLKEISRIKHQYIEQLKSILINGKLALHLTVFKDHKSFEDMILPILNWFDLNEIKITSQNYIPFYFIYALFGKEYKKIFLTDKDILIITNLTELKLKTLNIFFRSNGARSVSFLNISHNKALFEKIDLSSLKVLPNLVLIAAGVGSANILYQLQCLNAICLDIGIIIDAILNENLNRTRIFIDFS